MNEGKKMTQSNVVPLMDEEGQRLYLNAMLSNPELFARVQNILKPTYFDPPLAKGIKFIQEYFQEYRTIPATSVFTAATKLPVQVERLPRQDLEFVANQIAEFCRFQACISVIQKATGKDGYFEKGDLGTMVAKMKEATEIGLMVDLGIDYFEDVAARLADEEESPLISTGWKSVDAVIGGGVGLQELVVFLAPSGGGKSIGMLNLAYNFLQQGMDGVYISFEMRDRIVANRADQIIARITSDMVNLNKAQVIHEVGKFHERSGASFWIKRMREGSTANDVLAYLRQLESTKKFRPKFAIVDYLDIMEPVQKGVDGNMFLKDKYVSQEVRAIGFDLNCIMVSGAQLEKNATELINDGKKMTQSNVQGGSSKIQTSDLGIALCQSEAMAQMNEVRFEFPKHRNSSAGMKQVTLNWNKETCRISDLGSELHLKRKSTLQSEPPGASKRTLEDLAARYGKQ